MLIEFLKQILKILDENGKLVESYFMESDEKLKEEAEKVGHRGGVCIALAYRWIHHQLRRGVTITNKNPIFNPNTFSVKQKMKVALKYQAYMKNLDSLYGGSLSEGKSGVISKEVLELLASVEMPTPASAMIAPNDGVCCNVVACDEFGGWGSQKQGELSLMTAFTMMKNAIIDIADREQRLQSRIGAIAFDYVFQQNSDFYGMISVKGAKGHVIAVRCEGTWTKNAVHLFDPNIGHYRFESWKDMEDYLPLLWVAMYAKGSTKDATYPEEYRFRTWKLIQFRRGVPDAIGASGKELEAKLWKECTNKKKYIAQQWIILH